MLRSNSKRVRNHVHVVGPEEKKKAAVGRFCRKGRLYVWNERQSG